jgi:hypothetical protein
MTADSRLFIFAAFHVQIAEKLNEEGANHTIKSEHEARREMERWRGGRRMRDLFFFFAKWNNRLPSLLVVVPIYFIDGGDSIDTQGPRRNENNSSRKIM